jgi:hypothetical protein
MKHAGFEYTIHRGPRGWAWKVLSGADSLQTPLKLGAAKTRNDAIVMAQTTIEDMVRSASRSDSKSSASSPESLRDDLQHAS